MTSVITFGASFVTSDVQFVKIIHIFEVMVLTPNNYYCRLLLS